ncbi:hypothetical protein [Neobittarella massiliensis]|uniref:Uncharacterized protein n=2 Tax=Oscillospiraceae TaxID=216572 RepID=A0A8J6ID58_9FIRM|nr:hypothetical protein [Neobittarella massiliensis]MBC3515060.1 hypothetical protein [Neobittarella massiliensis]SCJ65152.1 Uncharacterised protein [uncultured Anaerotruncus sp.]
MSKVLVKVDDLAKAVRLYELASAAKSEVAVEQGQWRSPVVSPLGFFGLCAFNMKEPMTVISDDEDFIAKVKADTTLFHSDN